MTLAIYTRQSREKKDSVSIPSQIEFGNEFAKLNGFTPKIYNEGSGKSAWEETFKNRPAMTELLRDVNAGIIKTIWVLDESRISREEYTYLFFKSTLIANNVILYSQKEGKIDFSNFNDEFISDIRNVINRLYVNTVSINIKNSLLYNVKAGKVGGGLYKSYGYKKASDGSKLLVIDEEEAAIIKEIYNLYVSGNGTDKIASHLNKLKVPTKSSKVLKEGLHIKDKYTKTEKLIEKSKILWSGPVILEIIKNPIYKGERRYKGELYPAPKIIEPLLWNKAQEQVNLNRNKGGKIKHEYLLNDLLFCGRCKCGFKGRSRLSKRDHYYYCTSKNNSKGSCGIRSINIDYLNGIIWNMVTDSSTIARLAIKEVERLKNPSQIVELQNEEKVILSQIKIEESDRAKTIELYKRELISIDEADLSLNSSNQKLETLRNKLEIIQSQIDNQENTIEIINDIELFQKELERIKKITDFETKKKLIMIFIDNIIINYDDNNQNFIIDITVKFGNNIEQKATHKFYLDRDDDSGNFDFSMKNDKPTWNAKSLTEKLKKGILKFAPPSSKALGMWRLLEAVQILSPEKFHWRTMVFCF